MVPTILWGERKDQFLPFIRAFPDALGCSVMQNQEHAGEETKLKKGKPALTAL